ncbi:MAG: hypothetical protein ACR2FS_08320 [Phormidesmis sp.]
MPSSKAFGLLCLLTGCFSAASALLPGKALALDYTCADFENTHLGYTPSGDEYCQTENPDIRVAIVNGWTYQDKEEMVLIFINTEDLGTGTLMSILAVEPSSDYQESTSFIAPFYEGRYFGFTDPSAAHLTSIFEDEINATLAMERGF